MPYLAAAVMTCIYVYNLPLMIALVWCEQGYGVSLGMLSPRYALKTARRKIGKGRRPGRKRRSAGKALKLIPHLQIEYFSARLLIGTGDAAATALLCGGVRSLAGVLAGASKQAATDIRPEFSGKCLKGEADIVISMKLGRLLSPALASVLGRG